MLKSGRQVKIGIDIGGTFTDLVVMDESRGETIPIKVPSTPEAPSKAVVTAVNEAVRILGITHNDVSYFVHGTTIVLNTIIEGTGAKTALIVSSGCRSLLDLGRLKVGEQFHFYPGVAPPLVPRNRVFEISARTRADGKPVERVDSNQLENIAKLLKQEEVESCAVCLLHSYVNPNQEQEVAKKLKALVPEIQICTSSDIWPEIREYERAVIAVMNAYVVPKMGNYLRSLTTELRQLGVDTALYITKSNGGIMIAETAIERPVDTLLSGPASGVVGASFVAKSVGFNHCIGFDMGGTSADVSVIDFGEPVYSTGNMVGDYPVIMPSVDVASIGAGGGSIAWVDKFGVLKVGPRSAGADPGPVCYDKGGTAPTVTDAYLVCGFINPFNFLGGKIVLNKELATQTIASLGKKLNLGLEDTAEAILNIATSNMATALLPLMTKRGVDVKDYALLAYGGAGPVHAPLLAEEVGVDRVIIPNSPGTLCAMGSLVNDIKNDYVRTIRHALIDTDFNEIGTILKEMADVAWEWLDKQSAKLDRIFVVRTADMRYEGQAYEIEVEIDDEVLQGGYPVWSRKFHQKHQQIFKHADSEARIELINLRLRIVGKFPEINQEELSSAAAPLIEVGSREILYQQEKIMAKVYKRKDLLAGHVFEGPAIIEQDDTTVLVTPKFCGRVFHDGTVILEKRGTM